MNNIAEVTVLGCGTSTGVPAIGCYDPVCISKNPRNKRLRPSILIQTDESTLLIDTSPDLRQQALKHNLNKIDAVIYTHFHADHTFGIDDLRVFNMIMKKTIPCYAYDNTLKVLKQNFQYIFGKDNEHIGFKTLCSCKFYNNANRTRPRGNKSYGNKNRRFCICN